MLQHRWVHGICRSKLINVVMSEIDKDFLEKKIKIASFAQMYVIDISSLMFS